MKLAVAAVALVAVGWLILRERQRRIDAIPTAAHRRQAFAGLTLRLRPRRPGYDKPDKRKLRLARLWDKVRRVA